MRILTARFRSDFNPDYVAASTNSPRCAARDSLMGQTPPIRTKPRYTEAIGPAATRDSTRHRLSHGPTTAFRSIQRTLTWSICRVRLSNRLDRAVRGRNASSIAQSSVPLHQADVSSKITSDPMRTSLMLPHAIKNVRVSGEFGQDRPARSTSRQQHRSSDIAWKCAPGFTGYLC